MLPPSLPKGSIANDLSTTEKNPPERIKPIEAAWCPLVGLGKSVQITPKRLSYQRTGLLEQQGSQQQFHR